MANKWLILKGPLGHLWGQTPGTGRKPTYMVKFFLLRGTIEELFICLSIYLANSEKWHSLTGNRDK